MIILSDFVFWYFLLVKSLCTHYFFVSVFSKILAAGLILIFFLFIGKKCLAQDVFFDYYLPSKILFSGQVYKIKLLYNLSGADKKYFTVIPQAENLNVEIFNGNKNIWVNSSGLRTEYPDISGEIKVKITGSNGEKGRLCFNIQYSKTSEIFRTPCKTFWNGSVLNGYIAGLNAKISRWWE